MFNYEFWVTGEDDASVGFPKFFVAECVEFATEEAIKWAKANVPQIHGIKLAHEFGWLWCSKELLEKIWYGN